MSRSTLTISGRNAGTSKEGDPESFHMLVKVCHVLEYHQARLRAVSEGQAPPAIFSMNPKGFGHRALEAVCATFGKQINHIFMYRRCDKVVESFGSIFSAGQKGAGGPRGPGGKPKGPPPQEFVSQAMKSASTPLEPPPGLKGMALGMVLGWMDGGAPTLVGACTNTSMRTRTHALTRTCTRTRSLALDGSRAHFGQTADIAHGRIHLQRSQHSAQCGG